MNENEKDPGIVTLPSLSCQKCGHVWVPRVTRPELCPHCKGYPHSPPGKAGRKKNGQAE